MFKVKDKIYLKLQDKIIEMKTILRQKRTWRFCNLGSFFKKIFMLNEIRKKKSQYSILCETDTPFIF